MKNNGFYIFLACFALLVLGLHAFFMWDYALQNIWQAMVEHSGWYYLILLFMAGIGGLFLIDNLRNRNGRKH